MIFVMAVADRISAIGFADTGLARCLGLREFGFLYAFRPGAALRRLLLR
jgi:hypothetical protein